MDDSGARGAPRGRHHGGPRASGSPPRRRRCSSARSGSAHPGGARGPHDTRQRAGGGRAPATGAGRLIRRTRSRSSRSTSACPRPTRAGRATTTRSTPGPAGPGRRRKLSRSSRRARFRWTDPPTRRLTARPRRSKARPLGAATRRNRRPSRRAPRLNAASNSAPVRRRWRDRKRMRPRFAAPPAPQTAIRFRPFWRRRFRTSWPPFVRMRTRKPWVRFRRRLFGWNVLFIGEPHGPRRRDVAARRDKLQRLPEWRRACQTAAPSAASRRLVRPPARVVPFPGHGYPTTAASFMVPNPRFSTTVEISVQKGYGAAGRALPSRGAVCNLLIIEEFGPLAAGHRGGEGTQGRCRTLSGTTSWRGSRARSTATASPRGSAPRPTSPWTARRCASGCRTRSSASG